MAKQTIRERFWLWGMKVNVLQQTDEYRSLGFGTSTMTVEDAIRRTGTTNVIIAGGLPINEETLAAMPSATRIVCKTALHRHTEGQLVVDLDTTADTLAAAKRLAARDTRIEGFHLDDFSTGSLTAGATPEHLARLQFRNTVTPPHLPLGATIYTMSLNRPELAGVLPYFDRLLVPLWHADQIQEVPAAVARLSDISGGKPMVLCLYAFDFGNGRPIPADLMRRHLAVAEELLLEERVAGMCLCGTCMMDLEWESNRVMYEWLERVGSQKIGGH